MVAGLHVRHLRRYGAVGRLLVKYGRSDLASAAGFDVVPPEDERPDGARPELADELTSDLERLGPTFVKLGQLLSTRTDLVPPPYTEALARLQDDVTPMSFVEIAEVIEHELGMAVDDAFEWFDREPLASASLGQVHRARLGNGHDVVVKVQRPGVRRQVAEDLEAMQELAALLDERTDAGRRIGFGELVEQFGRALGEELDYRMEADNLLRLGGIVSPYQRLVVPSPVEELTTGRVLTMDYVPGRKITSISPVGRTDIPGDDLARELFSAYLDQVLVAGFFHADPHPGNILLTEDQRLVLLDLGMVARVPRRLQDGLLELLLAIADGEGEQAAQIAIEMGSTLDGFDEGGFTRAASALVARAADAPMRRLDAGTLVMQVCRAAADHALRLPPELALLGKALMNLDQITRTLAPAFEPASVLRDRLVDVLRGQAVPSRERLLTAALEARELVEQLPSRLNRLMDTVAQGSFHLKVDTIDEAELLTGIRQVANRVTMGLLLASLVIGAAMLAQVDTRAELFGYPALATIFFLLAAVGAIGLFVNIALDGRRRRR